jgi:hypothetical protein
MDYLALSWMRRDFKEKNHPSGLLKSKKESLSYPQGIRDLHFDAKGNPGRMRYSPDCKIRIIRKSFSILRVMLIFCLGMRLAAFSTIDPPGIELRRDDEAGKLSVYIDGQLAFIYQYIHWLDLPHYWPLCSPSGKNMVVQQAEPYPHHRSFYVADTVRLKGAREVSTYNALYSGQTIGRDAFGPPFRDYVCHMDFTRLEALNGRALIETKLVWEMDGDHPVLDENRRLVVHALGGHEYLIDMIFTLTASYGDVEFISDDVHYAWPYIRMHPRFSGDNGGLVTSDNGSSGEKATNMQVSLWMDYSNTIEGITEGLAVFQWPDGLDHRWLTREYGIFGPRRPDKQNGKPFTLKEGETITQRVGVLVHKGDVKTGRVAERYQKYIQGEWQR